MLLPTPNKDKTTHTLQNMTRTTPTLMTNTPTYPNLAWMLTPTSSLDRKKMLPTHPNLT